MRKCPRALDRADWFVSSEQTMNDYESSGQETSGCTGLKTTVCTNGAINVKRPQSDRVHSVFVDGDGDVIRCSCKGHKYNGHCVHQDEIGKRPLVRSSAVAAATDTRQQVATDGGRVEEPDMQCEECGHEWRESAEGAACPACDSTDRHPRRSERADFGGGESTGVVDL